MPMVMHAIPRRSMGMEFETKDLPDMKDKDIRLLDPIPADKVYRRPMWNIPNEPVGTFPSVCYFVTSSHIRILLFVAVYRQFRPPMALPICA